MAGTMPGLNTPEGLRGDAGGALTPTVEHGGASACRATDHLTYRMEVEGARHGGAGGGAPSTFGARGEKRAGRGPGCGAAPSARAVTRGGVCGGAKRAAFFAVSFSAPPNL